MKGSITSKRTLGDDGEWVVMPVYKLDGKEVTAETFAEFFPDREPGVFMAPTGNGYPIMSEALAVNPRDIKNAEKLDVKVGAPPTQYNSLGQPILRSAQHRREYIRAHGVHDRNCFN